MSKTYINIGGQTREQTGNEPPRRFRDAWMIDGDAITLDPVKQREIYVAEVKAEAGRRILAIAPEHKQRNLTARASILAAKGSANWSTDEQAEWDEGEAVWAQIKAIRDRSNVIEQGDILDTETLRADATWADA